MLKTSGRCLTRGLSLLGSIHGWEGGLLTNQMRRLAKPKGVPRKRSRNCKASGALCDLFFFVFFFCRASHEGGCKHWRSDCPLDLLSKVPRCWVCDGKSRPPKLVCFAWALEVAFCVIMNDNTDVYPKPCIKSNVTIETTCLDTDTDVKSKDTFDSRVTAALDMKDMFDFLQWWFQDLQNVVLLISQTVTNTSLHIPGIPLTLSFPWGCRANFLYYPSNLIISIQNLDESFWYTPTI